VHPNKWRHFFANKQVVEIQTSNESKNVISKCVTKHNEGHSNGNKLIVFIAFGALVSSLRETYTSQFVVAGAPRVRNSHIIRRGHRT
jgi:hypothetical protein